MDTTKQITVKSLFAKEDVQERFKAMLGKKAQGFITSVLQIASSNQMLANADPFSIYNAAAVAATLDLPLNNSLGFAYIVPYNQKQSDGSYKQVAQFQIGYKGLIQLAQRSGQFKTISATPIYEGQIVEMNPLTGIKFDFSIKSSVVVGYAGYFELINGFQKTMYLTVEEIKKHGGKYSKTFNHKNGLWNTDFDSMATKTVIKLLLGKFAPMSVEMQTAQIADQAVIKNPDTNEVVYVDHEDVTINKEEERVMLMIDDCKSIEDLEKLKEQLKTQSQWDAFDTKKLTLQNQ